MEKIYGRRRVSSIDPMFFIPDGVDELEYSEENYNDDLAFDTSRTGADGESEDKIPVPTILSVSQTVKKTKAGMDTVDIIIMVEDIDGIKEFEVRVAKV